MKEPIEYIEIEHEDEVYIFDVNWLLSSWHCIYGQGCKGTDLVDWHGCCQIGAHLDEDPEIRQRELVQIETALTRMDDSEFANPKRAKEIRQSWYKREGENLRTRIREGACIFLNPPDHPNGAGCSLHQAALKRGENYQDWKPEVCSWMALFEVELTDADDLPTRWLVRCENRFWTVDASYDFNDWFCIDDEHAYVGDHPPVYQSMEYEIRRRFGDVLYERLAAYLDVRRREVPVTIGRRHGDGFRREDQTEL